MNNKLTVFIEINGTSIYVGDITGDTPSSASFLYSPEYLSNPESRPISISLPLTETSFSPEQTKIFFDGLLPEGFTRRCVANWMHVDENDYLSILAGLGHECLGAVRIVAQNSPYLPPEYRRLTDTEAKNLAREGATESAQLITKSHLSLTGASGKVGLYYDERHNQWYLPVGDAPSTHIVKQSHVRLQEIVANEQLCLLAARSLGIDVPESFIVNIGNFSDSDVLFATRRYDRKIHPDARIINGLPVPYRLHQEDFAQALGIASVNKYEKEHENYLKRMFGLLRGYSANPVTDQLKLWDICIYNYLVGNTDNHIKNLSLLYSPDLKSIRLAPAYDIISTVIYESSTENMALSIGGIYKLNKITRQSFEEEAKHIGLGTNLAMKRFDMMVSHFQEALDQAVIELELQGFVHAHTLKEKILSRGGIRNQS